ncbi:MAG: hypothetical protein JWN67_30 [Actinomycetia bacterium]|nr:hypothetical protein [Actinomycetes bacterium]
MGRAGIRRRKPRRPLPKLSGKAWPGDDTPPTMWSAPGSGFEASPFSPAGRIQGMWRMTRGVNERRRQGRPLPRSFVVGSILVILAVLALPVIAALLGL